MNAANSCGVLPTGSVLWLSSRSRTSGSMQRAHELAVQPVHDRRRRCGGREPAEPADHFETGQARFRDRRQLRRDGRALRARDRERAQLARLDLRRRGERDAEERLHLPRDDFGERGPPPL